ncbi:hypothetical protein IAT38_006923 [Cryptococcus sp. DSM 104549]
MFTSAELLDFSEKYYSLGFVIIPNLIPSSLLPTLTEAADGVTERAREGRWPQVRVVGKPFPPWDAGDDIWGVQNLMHPDLEERVFAEWYGSEGILEVSAALMGSRIEDMQFELFNLLINPLDASYSLVWHRDDVKPDVSPAEELQALLVDRHGVQWNSALYDDECLSVVPSSHARVRTEAEREAMRSGEEMPGAMVVQLKKGETVFYNNNILHVGKYDAATKRRTLHGCYGSPPPGDTTRARNILQHDVGYTLDPAFKASVPERLRGMVDKLNEMQKLLEGKEIVYSQD